MPIAVAKVTRRPRAQEVVPSNIETPFAAPLAWPLDQWLALPAALFKASEPAMLGWIERRCAAASALLDSVAGFARCDDLSAAAAVHATWLEGATGRLEADVRAMTEHAAAVSQCVASLAEPAAPGEIPAGGTVWQGPERRSPSRPWSEKSAPPVPATS
jgi:hypothetical protein